jgi:hypothetical protein
MLELALSAVRRLLPALPHFLVRPQLLTRLSAPRERGLLAFQLAQARVLKLSTLSRPLPLHATHPK